MGRLYQGDVKMIKLNPKEDKFYNLFKKQSQNVLDGAKLLKSFLDTMNNEIIFSQDIQSLEHKGDEIVHKIIAELSVAFVTPIDREDIYAIAKKLDDSIDYTQSIIDCFVMYNVKECTAEAKIFANFIVQAAEEVVELMNVLSNMTKSKESKIINQKIIAVNRIENEADVLFRDVVGKMFRSEEIDVLELIKWKDLYQEFEKAIDSFEVVVNIIGGVVMKNA